MDKVLIVDDDGELRSILIDVMHGEGYQTCEAADGLEACEVFRNTAPDAVILDLQMPRRGGLQTLREIREIDPIVPVIMLTAHGDIPTAVEAVKLGAHDFVSKPPDYDLLVLMVQKALEKTGLAREVRRITTALESTLESTFGTSPAIRKVIAMISQVARTDLAVIIQGETGTGKSFVANAIHTLSRRAGKPFVRVDISVLPETLVESELFGAKKGSYTGSEEDREGFFANADGGTIFLDDIENMSALVQAKLLDAIEHKRIVPVGRSEEVSLDFRVITATNRDIRRCVEEQRFREDLFYRLGEFMIVVPPLRERPEDIRFFMERFLVDARTELSRPVRRFAPDAAERLLRHHWPGNVRELKNVVRRAVLLTEGELIRKESVDLLIHHAGQDGDAASSLSLKEALRETERKLICRALGQTAGNRTQTARLLEISLPHLRAKIREFGLGEN